MHEDDFLGGSENQVWAAREIFCVETVPVPHSVHKAAKGQFGTGVLCMDCRHDGGALFCRDMIHHTLRSPKQRPLIINVFFGRIAQNPGGGNFFLARESFYASIDFGWKTNGCPNGTRPRGSRTHD